MRPKHIEPTELSPEPNSVAMNLPETGNSDSDSARVCRPAAPFEIVTRKRPYALNAAIAFAGNSGNSTIGRNSPPPPSIDLSSQ